MYHYQQTFTINQSFNTTALCPSVSAGTWAADASEHASRCLSILSPFHKATVELSEEKTVSGSKVIPLLKMIEKMLQEGAMRSTNPLARELEEHLIKLVREKLQKLCKATSIVTFSHV